MNEVLKNKINEYRKLEEKITKKYNEKIQKIEKTINILENKSQIKEDTARFPASTETDERIKKL